MSDIEKIEQRLLLLKEWIERAFKALKSYYREDCGLFWRDNLASDEESHAIRGRHRVTIHNKLTPTSTARSFFALFEYARFQNEEKIEPEIHDCVDMLEGVTRKYFRRIPSNISYYTKSSVNKNNAFTNSHILTALCCLEPLERTINRSLQFSRLQGLCKYLARSIVKDITLGMEDQENTHDFIVLHTVRGLDMFSRELIAPALSYDLQRRVKERIVSLLSYNFARINSKFDAAELAFSVALLTRFRTEDADQLIERALLSIAEAQKDGAWPVGRGVSYQQSLTLHIASFDVALTLTHTLLGKIHANDLDGCKILLQMLDSSFELIRSSYGEGSQFKGWCNDHARREGLFESWTTAIVLTFLIHYYDANVKIRQRQISRRYRLRQPSGNSLSFPDMESVLRQPGWIKKIKALTDPTGNKALSFALEEKILEPIRTDFVHRPRQAASIILYGKPGTGKTSLAKSIADALGWPFITISPPDFLKNGLEGFEATAASIFDDLQHMRRTVVLFDECEDFFRVRPEKQNVESRTAGAFITSGMLPRLQDLRDNSWIVFILATNSSLKDLDNAVTRPGRFDFSYEVPFPSVRAAVRFATEYLKIKLGRDAAPAYVRMVDTALHKYFKQKRKASKKPEVSFAIVKAFVNRLLQGEIDRTAAELSYILKELEGGPPSLI